MKESMAKRFCQCIKKVRKTIKGNYKKQQKESRAIAICVKSVIQTRGKTLKKFKCGKKPTLKTQTRK